MSEKMQEFLAAGWTQEHSSRFTHSDGRILYRNNGYWMLKEPSGKENKIASMLADAITRILNG